MKLIDEYHKPVLLEETLNFLITKKDGLYIDGTLGGGGHAAEILKKLDSGGKLIGFDKDPDAIAHCNERFKDFLLMPQPKIEIRNTSFDEAHSIEANISGILLDLGVSSHQLDTPTRGISYRFDSPLDMRLGNVGITAKELIVNSSEEELFYILKKFGEEPFSKILAKLIFQNRERLNTVFELKELILSNVPAKIATKSLSRSFQAFRIAINYELDILTKTLSNIVPKLEKGGRAVVISYHSLEDRITKNIFKNFVGPKVHQNKYKNNNLPVEYKILTKDAIIPSENEVNSNPRSRSAKLRVIEKN